MRNEDRYDPDTTFRVLVKVAEKTGEKYIDTDRHVVKIVSYPTVILQRDEEEGIISHRKMRPRIWNIEEDGGDAE